MHGKQNPWLKVPLYECAQGVREPQHVYMGTRNWSRMTASTARQDEERAMKKSKFSEEQIAYALRQVQSGTAPADVCLRSASARPKCPIELSARQGELTHPRGICSDGRRPRGERYRYTVLRRRSSIDRPVPARAAASVFLVGRGRGRRGSGRFAGVPTGRLRGGHRRGPSPTCGSGFRTRWSKGWKSRDSFLLDTSQALKPDSRG